MHDDQDEIRDGVNSEPLDPAVQKVIACVIVVFCMLGNFVFTMVAIEHYWAWALVLPVPTYIGVMAYLDYRSIQV